MRNLFIFKIYQNLILKNISLYLFDKQGFDFEIFYFFHLTNKNFLKINSQNFSVSEKKIQ